MLIKNAFGTSKWNFLFLQVFYMDLLERKKYISCKYLWNNLISIVFFYVKLYLHQTKSVEMRAKSVWQVKINNFLDVIFLFFSFWDIVGYLVVFIFLGGQQFCTHWLSKCAYIRPTRMIKYPPVLTFKYFP